MGRINESRGHRRTSLRSKDVLCRLHETRRHINEGYRAQKKVDHPKGREKGEEYINFSNQKTSILQESVKRNTKYEIIIQIDNNQYTSLIDRGSTHSFISKSITRELNLKHESLAPRYLTELTNGKLLEIKRQGCTNFKILHDNLTSYHLAGHLYLTRVIGSYSESTSCCLTTLS